MEFYSLFIIFLFFSYSYLPKNVIQLQGFPIFPLFFCSISTSCFSFCTPKNDLFSFLTNGVFNFIHDPLFSSRILFHLLYNYHNFVSAKCSFLTIYAHIHFTYPNQQRSILIKITLNRQSDTHRCPPRAGISVKLFYFYIPFVFLVQACIASIILLRNPFSSSTRTASMVVPAGEHTISFNSPGCFPVSSTILALP